jgi:2-dehydro-3-deoxyphosphooctonate aldolase (KDO 8-P synthase)
VHSFRGCGFDKGLQWLSDIKNKFNVPVITDVHEPYQVKDVACVADVLQLPAFLSRQTDLVIELAKTNKPINVKKAQFLSPQEMTSIVAKFKESGNENIILCERGTSFGYNNLVVDMLGFDIMKQTGCPVLFDVTHSLQLPGAGNEKAGGRRQQALQLAKAGISQGIAGLFLETHPDPDIAKCDGPCALPLSLVDDFVSQVVELDRVVKNQNKLIIN